ncbi:hypothetical protein M0R45_026134 [Rubus argutus]|uniref:Uncharacterized protein n=1 Tax=Rubus argutus TaxID=59490 RepID=A0AAW1WYX9_RUBAR
MVVQGERKQQHQSGNQRRRGKWTASPAVTGMVELAVEVGDGEVVDCSGAGVQLWQSERNSEMARIGSKEMEGLQVLVNLN